MELTYYQVQQWIVENEQAVNIARINRRNISGLKKMRAELETLVYKIKFDFRGKQSVIDLLLPLS